VPDAADLAVPSAGAGPSREPRAELPLPPRSLAQASRGAALDFAEYAVEVVDYVTATGDVTPMRQISYGCDGCDGIVEDVRAVYRQGGWSQGGDWRVLSSTAASDGRHAWDVSLQVHAQRQRVKRSQGSPVEFVGGGRRAVGMSVAFADGGWVLTALNVA